jgi:hypothetical protein
MVRHQRIIPAGDRSRSAISPNAQGFAATPRSNWPTGYPKRDWSSAWSIVMASGAFCWD